jgi:hypothetical protein
MDADRFDTLARSLTPDHSRRGFARLLGGLALGGLFILGAGESLAGKRKGKKKKKKKKNGGSGTTTGTCTPQCLGRRCGSNGCGGACGACAECQSCDPTLGRCPMTPGSNEAGCSGGACCGGACCPSSCQCGVDDPLLDALASEFAASQGLPYPSCFAAGTGDSCGAIGSCQPGTTCQLIGGTGVGVCFGLCAGVRYPSLELTGSLSRRKSRRTVARRQLRCPRPAQGRTRLPHAKRSATTRLAAEMAAAAHEVPAMVGQPAPVKGDARAGVAFPTCMTRT